MATSGTLRKSMSNYFDFLIYWEVTSQNATNNTSTVKIQWVTEKKQANSATYNLNSKLTAKYENTTAQDAVTVGWDMRNTAVGGWQTLYTTTVTVNHNTDGTKSLYLYGYLNVGSLSAASSAEVSGYATLPTIARSSGISATSNYIGSTSTITIDKKSSSYTTTVSYKINGASSFVAIQTKSTATSINWTIPETCYSYLPSNSKKVTITLQCITYNGSTQIGTATTTITATAVDSVCRPTVTASYSFDSATNNLTGATNVGILNFSTITVNLAITTKYDATVSTNTVTLDGTTKSGTSVSFTKLPTDSFSYTVKDSRGFTATGTVHFTFVQYITPTCSVTLSPINVLSSKVTITIKGDWYNGKFTSSGTTNALTLQYQYKLSTASSYTSVTVTPTKSGNTYTATAELTVDSTKTYNIRARVHDSANTSYIYASAKTLQSTPIVNFGSNNFDVNVPLNLKGAVNINDNASIATTGYITAPRLTLTATPTRSTVSPHEYPFLVQGTAAGIVYAMNQPNFLKQIGIRYGQVTLSYSSGISPTTATVTVSGLSELYYADVMQCFDSTNVIVDRNDNGTPKYTATSSGLTFTVTVPGGFSGNGTRKTTWFAIGKLS